MTGTYDGVLVFGVELPGTGTDTVRTAVKRYAYFTIGFEDRYAADVGLVFSAGDGFARALTYYRVGNEEHGVARFPVAAEGSPNGAGQAITVLPNPLRSGASVVLTLDRADLVAVEVYDTLGRRVAVLHDGPLPAGETALPFEASALPVGLYLVRVIGASTSVAVPVTIAR